MNKYKISFLMFSNNNPKVHFSNCQAEIQGESFEEALKLFKEKRRKEGCDLGFVCEGDMFEVGFFDKTENK